MPSDRAPASGETRGARARANPRTLLRGAGGGPPPGSTTVRDSRNRRSRGPVTSSIGLYPSRMYAESRAARGRASGCLAGPHWLSFVLRPLSQSVDIHSVDGDGG